MRSLVNNVNFCKLEALLSSMACRLDIISVTETWIKPQKLGAILNLAGKISFTT